MVEYNDGDIVYIYSIDGSNATVISCAPKATVEKSALQGNIVDAAHDSYASTIQICTLTIPSNIEIDGKTYYVTDISDNAFIDRKDLTIIIIPDTVTNIGYRAFSGCSSLVSIIVGKSVITIGSEAFSNCSSLVSIKLPYSVEAILKGTFLNCSGLSSIIIPNLNTIIDPDAFENCDSLARFYKI
jgi:hypothetical protein